jgi:rod shape-determining protein MreC
MKRKNILTFFVISLIVLGIVSADRFLGFKIGQATASYTRPVAVVFSSLGSNVSGFFRNIVKVGDLQSENRDLQDKLDKALIETSRLSAAQQENDDLKANLNFKKSNRFDLIGANVIFFDPNNIRETITLDVGKNDGINKGNVVLSRGFLVGKVKEVTARTAKILLITDPESAIPAMVVNTNSSGIVNGKIGNNLVLDQIPQSEKVRIGDLVSTSGLGNQFPKGLLIGKIESIQQISGSIFQSIEVRPMVDLNILSKVMVIKE